MRSLLFPKVTNATKAMCYSNKIVFLLLALIIFVPLAGAVYEAVATRKVARNNPPAGRLIEVGGRRTHLYCVGSGAPTVIFVSGLGETYASWARVQPEIGKSTKACSYDRAGLGWSDPGREPRDVHQIVSELHDLLGATDVTPPYLLVGHSLGGGVIRVFAARYPQEVDGLVMIDAVHPEFLRRMKLDAWDENMLRTARWMQLLAPFGIARLEGRCVIDNRPLIRCRSFWKTFAGERDALSTSLKQVGEVTSLGTKPLVVLSRDPDPTVGWGTLENRSAWEEMQEELSRLSTQGRQTTLKGATHYIQDDRPDAVSETILNMLAVVRAQPTRLQ